MSQSSSDVVLITGASSGIGLELAKLFAKDGHSLFLVARDGARLRELTQELQSAHGIQAFYLPGDLTEPSFRESLAGKVQEHGFRASCLVNNAGSGVAGNFEMTDWQDEERSIVLNALVPTYLTKVFLSDLKAAQGSVLNIVSMSAFVPHPHMAVYAATKAYLGSLSESLSMDLVKSGIRITSVYPGAARTGFQKNNHLPELPARFPDARVIAQKAYQAWQKGKRCHVIGLQNRLIVFLLKFTPRVFVRWYASIR